MTSATRRNVGWRGLTWARRVWRILEIASLVAGAVCLITMLVYVVANVMLRYIATSGLPATTEFVSGWWMVPVAFFGWVAAERHDEHIRVSVFTGRLTGRLARLVDALATLTALGLLVYVGWAGWNEAQLALTQGEYGVDSGLPLWPVRFVIPVATALMGVLLVKRLVFGPPSPRDDQTKELTA